MNITDFSIKGLNSDLYDDLQHDHKGHDILHVINFIFSIRMTGKTDLCTIVLMGSECSRGLEQDYVIN